jgi:hypothetical protein
MTRPVTGGGVVTVGVGVDLTEGVGLGFGFGAVVLGAGVVGSADAPEPWCEHPASATAEATSSAAVRDITPGACR